MFLGKKISCILIALYIGLNNILALDIHGTVVDENESPLQYTNVISLRDSTFINGTITDANGVFHLNNVDSTDIITIRLAGYDDCNVTPQENMGTIVMHLSAKVLAEVTVNANRPTTRLNNHGMVTTITGSTLADVGTADDVIGKLPLVTGKDGSFTVFGAGTPVIYINGRKVRDSSELQLLASNNIKSVEVVTNPGVQYSMGTCAVIRIMTFKPYGEGIGFDLWSRNSVSHYPSTSDMINIRYRTASFDIFGTGYFAWAKGRNIQFFDQTTYASDVYYQELRGKNTYINRIFNGKIGINWQINETHSIGMLWQSGVADVPASNFLTTRMYVNEKDTEYWESSGDFKSKTQPNDNANIYYNGTLGKYKIDFNMDYVNTVSSSNGHETESSVSEVLRVITSYSQTKGRLLAEKLVISGPLWKGEIEIGEEYTNTQSNYHYTYEGLTIPSNKSNIHEQNISAFTTLYQTFGKCMIGIGLRYEHAFNKYYVNDIVNDQFSQSYNDIFPMTSFSGKFGDFQIGLNFTKKLQRPSYNELDGTLQYVNRITYQQGNPYLIPSKLYNIQLQSIWKYLFIHVTFKHKKDAILNTTQSVDFDPSARLITFMNVPHLSNLNMAIGIQQQIKFWEPDATLGIEKQWYKGIYRGFEKKFNTPMLYLQTNNWFRLPHNWLIGISFMAKSGGSYENGFMKPINSLDISVNKTFLNKNLSIWFNASDILDGAQPRGTMYVGDYSISMNPHCDSRSFSLSLRYTFNYSKDKYKGTGAGESEKQRL